MAVVSKPQLLEVVVQSIYSCGWQVLYLNQGHPFELKILDGEESQRLKIIIYNLSHGGGRQRPINEYRIQFKVINITQPIGYRTLILGYWGDVDVFAGFDNSKHKTPRYSSSATEIEILEEIVASEDIVINDETLNQVAQKRIGDSIHF